MGEERFNSYMEAFNEEAPTSIRLNTGAMNTGARPQHQVPWCKEGFYLEGRPQFTFDPLFHAGCYYVQEAASMFVTHVLRQFIHEPVAMLDLCAAPGGKSTAARSVLPGESVLVSNEPIPTRAQILLENITKWGWSDCIVTNPSGKDKVRRDTLRCALLGRRNVPQGSCHHRRMEPAECGEVLASATGDRRRCLGMSQPWWHPDIQHLYFQYQGERRECALDHRHLRC